MEPTDDPLFGDWENMSEIMNDVTGDRPFANKSPNEFQLIGNLEGEVEVLTDYKREYEQQQKRKRIDRTKTGEAGAEKVG